MQKPFRWFKRIVIFSVLITMVAAVVMREEIHRLVNVKTLFEEDRIVQNFSSLDQVFDFVVLARGERPVLDLPLGEPLEISEEFEELINNRSITSMLILHKGQIVHESYHQGTQSDDLRIGWALSKPYLSALTGILLEDGTLQSLDDIASKYVPELSDTAYRDVRLRDLLLMTSGVDFDEDYVAYGSDINRMGRELALGGTLDEFALTLKDKHAEPGEAWNYVSIDAHVLSMVIRAASGQTLPELLSERLLSKIGLETEPYVLADADNVAFLPGGINKTTRDFARFGLLYAQMGKLNGEQIIPKDWADQSTKRIAPRQEDELGYGYHWWIPRDAAPGQFFAHGIYGQYLFIDQVKNIVIVTTSADIEFIDAGFHEANLDFFLEITNRL